MSKGLFRINNCFLLLLLLIIFGLGNTENVLAGCRENGCSCSGTWSNTWEGNAQNSCVGTDCWYNPTTGNGCRGHIWYYYKTIRETTCTQDGQKEYLCSNCSGHIIKTEAATGHEFSTWEKADELTHSRVCSNCGETESENHTYGKWQVISSKEKNRTCSKCGYTDQWSDYDAPEIRSFIINPSDWIDAAVTISFTVSDTVSGIDSIELKRTAQLSGNQQTVFSFDGNGTTDEVKESYTESLEGIYSYVLYVKDTAGNEMQYFGGTDKIDLSDPKLDLADVDPDWTNAAPEISASGTDYLTGTTITGSGINQILITDHSGNIVSEGISAVSFVVDSRYEGIFSWTVIAEDQVGHTVSRSVITKYDGTKPLITGTESTVVETADGEAGYCADNIITQSIKDPACSNGQSGSGLKSVILYKVKNGTKEAVISDTTRKVFTVQSADNSFEISYDTSEDDADYYMIVVQDFAGNITTKKLVSQSELLKSFHTSIDRSSYR